MHDRTRTMFRELPVIYYYTQICKMDERSETPPLGPSRDHLSSISGGKQLSFVESQDCHTLLCLSTGNGVANIAPCPDA